MADLTPGEKRWTILYGAYRGPEQQALLEVYRGMGRYVNYVMPIRPAAGADSTRLEHVLWLGTAESNPLIADLVARRILPSPSGPQGFTLDGRIAPSVSLFAEMLWNPNQTDSELLARAMRPYVNCTTV